LQQQTAATTAFMYTLLKCLQHVVFSIRSAEMFPTGLVVRNAPSIRDPRKMQCPILSCKPFNIDIASIFQPRCFFNFFPL
jgi:hypothetical protein